MSRRKRKFGATGEFPEGRLNTSDEGELVMGVAHDSAHVVVSFGKPIAWLGMSPKDARGLAGLLLTHAEAVEGGAQ